MMLNKLSLNTIGLNRIGLNRIGKPSRGSSVRPYIDPEVLASLKAVCICYGKSNDDPDRAIVKNLVDPDNPFIISNAAYKLNSGYGLYEDFSIYKSPNKNVVITDTKIKAIGELNAVWVAYSQSSINQYKVKITGIPNGGRIGYIYRLGGVGKEFYIYKDGIYNIPASDADDGLTGYLLNNIYNDWSNLTIEQIPSYQGAFVTDGVDDLITSTKTVQEMLGGSNEVTVVSMIGQLSTPNVNNYTNTIRNQLGTTGSYNKIAVSAIDKTGIYGYSFDSSLKCSIINDILGDKQDYSVSAATQVENIGVKYLVQGWIDINGLARELSSVAWYWTVIANKVLTTDQINQVIAYYNLDRCVEPTVWYDVQKQGLSNDTPDSDWYLKDYSGNGYDMTLYNYAKTPESGINEDGGLQSDGVDDYGKVTGLPIYKDYTVVTDREIFANIGAISSKNNSGAFVETAGNSVYSFGQATSGLNFISTRSISYLSKYSYCGQSITAGAAEDGTDMWLGTIRDNDTRFFNGAIYSLMSFPYSMSEFLIERQLKKHKLGTLYPDMVEFRPIVNSNVKYQDIIFRNTSTGEDLVAGQYYDLGTISIFIKPLGCDEATAVKVNNVDAEFNSYDKNSGYYRFDSVVTKSPQKINITIDEYIRFEDIVQPYPSLFILIDYDTEEVYSWGSKLKVGARFKGNVVNLLPNMYEWQGDVLYNGEVLNWGINPGVVAKEMVFSWSMPFKYLIDNNEPKCILSPRLLRIPNSSYKILGYIPDISGHGNHGKINNSAYAGMSGVNGYTEQTFSNWRYNTAEKRAEFTISNDVKLNIAKVIMARGAILYTLIGDYTTTNSIQRYKVTGVDENHPIVFGNDAPFDALLTVTTDGEYEVDWKTYGKNPCIFTTWTGDCNITIEQIGEYEGAYCLDGVDDFITIPTTVGGKQVLMKVNWQSSIGQGMLYDQRGIAFAIWNSDKYNDDETDTIPAYSARNGGNTYIDGILNKNILASQLRNITHNIVATNTMLNESSVSPTIGCRTEHNAYFTNMSLYDFMLFDNISTDDKIKQLNEYVGIEGNTDDLFN